MTEKIIIGVFCYKRAGKLKASMEALLQNPECSSMDIIFFCDGYKGEQDKQGVLETRSYIDSLTGFRHVIKHYREKNFSTGPNFFEGLNYLCNHYDKFIIIEDDLVVTPNYIKYMLDGLSFYQHDPSVFCITGYCFPIMKRNYSYDTIIHRRFCSYGWASWSNRVKEVTWDKEGLTRLMKTSPDFKKRLNREGQDLYRMLVKQVNGKISTWDIQMQVHVSERRMKVVYPVISKACNIGFDNESTNTFGVDYLKTTLDDGEQRVFDFCDADRIDAGLQKQLQQPYGLRALVTRKLINTMIKYTT